MPAHEASITGVSVIVEKKRLVIVNINMLDAGAENNKIMLYYRIDIMI